MSTEELRKAVDALRFIPGVDYETFGAIWKGMRDQEAEIARLRGLLGQCYAISGADTDGDPPERHADYALQAVTDLRRDYDEVLDWQARCEKAEALLRECVENREGLAYETDLLTRITAHLGAEHD